MFRCSDVQKFRCLLEEIWCPHCWCSTQDSKMLSSPHRVMHRLAQDYGPVMRVVLESLLTFFLGHYLSVNSGLFLWMKVMLGDQEWIVLSGLDEVRRPYSIFSFSRVERCIFDNNNLAFLWENFWSLKAFIWTKVKTLQPFASSSLECLSKG